MTGQKHIYDGQTAGNRKANISYLTSPNTRSTVFPYPSPDRVHKVLGENKITMLQAMSDLQSVMTEGQSAGPRISAPQSPALNSTYAREVQKINTMHQMSQSSVLGMTSAKPRSGVLLSTANYQGQQLNTRPTQQLTAETTQGRGREFGAGTSIRLERCFSDSTEFFSSSMRSENDSHRVVQPLSMNSTASSSLENGSRGVDGGVLPGPRSGDANDFNMDFNALLMPNTSDAHNPSLLARPQSAYAHNPRTQSPAEDSMAMLDRILSMDHMETFKQMNQDAQSTIDTSMHTSLTSTLSGPISYFSISETQQNTKDQGQHTPVSQRQASVPVQSFVMHPGSESFAHRQISAPIPRSAFDLSVSPSMPAIVDVAGSPVSPMASVLTESSLRPVMRSMTDMLPSPASAPLLQMSDGVDTNGYRTNSWYSQMDGGTLKTTYATKSLPGYTRVGTIILTFDMECGIIRKAYLPDSDKGKAVRVMMGRAFEAGLLFESRAPGTSAKTDLVFKVELKTRRTGGKTISAYPDPKYLDSVSAQLTKLLENN